MAELISNDQMAFNCPICLDLLKNPVSIPCGHSYCRSCIECYWHHDQSGGYRCPQCRQTFTLRPALNKNTLIAEMVEKMKITEETSTVGPGNVECDICTETKNKAVKSCLVCQASFCEAHLQPHFVSPTFKSHKLVQASARLQVQVCSRHQKPLEVFCHTDQLCICVLCTMDKHRGHKMVTAAAYREENEIKLVNTKGKFLQKIKDKEDDFGKLRMAVESHKCSTQAAVEYVQKFFTELGSFLEQKESEMKEMISAQEEETVSQAEYVQEELEQEVADLKRRNENIEELLQTHDDVLFLQSFQSFSTSPEVKESPTFSLSPYNTFEDVTETLDELQEELEERTDLIVERVAGLVKAVEIIQKPEPKTRDEFLEYSCLLTLDTNTANRSLSLSEDDQEVTCTKEGDWYPDHPERFLEHEQVLCKEGLAGRCYWEVQWSGKLGVSIAVAYKAMERAQYYSLFGRDYNSWRLKVTEKCWHFWHNDAKTEVAKLPNCSRVGVYLDHKAGTLSFYHVSDPMILLHKVQTKFKEPVYPGFKINRDSVLKICYI